MNYAGVWQIMLILHSFPQDGAAGEVAASISVMRLEIALLRKRRNYEHVVVLREPYEDHFGKGVQYGHAHGR